MKSFEELEEVVHSINEMEQIFKGIAIEAAHMPEIQRYTELKDRTFEILVKDVRKTDFVEDIDLIDVCSESLTECLDCENCSKEE